LGENEILSDVVYIIRKFQPDVIITRFPEDARAGHGHHSASAILAREAFVAAADTLQFTEHFALGVKPWKAKRILWNTFRFGGTNTTAENQFKIDVGIYNNTLGKGYGEIASESRSQHKSQGFGVPRDRGQSFEYFSPILGEAPTNELLDGIVTNWDREEAPAINEMVDAIAKNYEIENPQKSVTALLELKKKLATLPVSNWVLEKQQALDKIICSTLGIYTELTTNKRKLMVGDTINCNFLINARNTNKVEISNIKLLAPEGQAFNSAPATQLEANKNWQRQFSFIPTDAEVTQPYWLQESMQQGYFTIKNKALIGKAENDAAVMAEVRFLIGSITFYLQVPLQYKHTDPVKGELYEPITIYPKATLAYTKENFLVINNKPAVVTLQVNNKAAMAAELKQVIVNGEEKGFKVLNNKPQSIAPNADSTINLQVTNANSNTVTAKLQPQQNSKGFTYAKDILYDHIPPISYFKPTSTNIIALNLKTVGKKIGYIVGAGDKVPAALTAMGYEVNILAEKDITKTTLATYDAIITGVRAYNVHEYLSDKYNTLMEYVQNGGNLIVQYNTNNQIGPVKSKISPYPFTITRTRVTEEQAEVRFLLPNHKVLHSPNEITQSDFEGWVQERSIYHADNIDGHYETPLAMNDKGEPSSNGSLLITPYGKGNFVYTGLVFFRELPAGVPGAYRLLANIIGLEKNK